MLIKYQEHQFARKTLALIEHANALIAEYESDGLILTLRQLYYLFVARDLFPDDCKFIRVNNRWKRDPKGTKNAEPNYDNLGKTLSLARIAGLVSWDAMEDRTRFVRQNSHWDDPSHIINECAGQFQIDKWQDQANYVEVWIEKDALVGLIDRICGELDVAYFSCRGYTSQSEQWRAGMRLRRANEAGKHVVVLHLGDHDPSGIDMTRDNAERLSMFAGTEVEVQRIALNMDQVREFNPPPNPTKLSDCRAQGYIDRFGEECWELDALNPRYVRDLISKHVKKLRKEKLWKAQVEQEKEYKAQLEQISEGYDDIVDFLKHR